MASVTSICNLALARIKAPSITSISEDTNQGRLCNIMYEPCRDACLEAHPWNFAIKRATLASDATAPNHEFDYRFAVPDDFLRLVRTGIEAEGYDDIAYRVENGFILINESTLEIEYIAKITDPNVYSATFIDMLAQRLAAELAIPFADNANLAQSMWQIYDTKLREARLSDAQQGTPREYSAGPWLTARL
jgi:hypothetical protein